MAQSAVMNTAKARVIQSAMFQELPRGIIVPRALETLFLQMLRAGLISPMRLLTP